MQPAGPCTAAGKGSLVQADSPSPGADVGADGATRSAGDEDRFPIEGADLRPPANPDGLPASRTRVAPLMAGCPRIPSSGSRPRSSGRIGRRFGDLGYGAFISAVDHALFHGIT